MFNNQNKATNIPHETIENINVNNTTSNQDSIAPQFEIPQVDMEDITLVQPATNTPSLSNETMIVSNHNETSINVPVTIVDKTELISTLTTTSDPTQIEKKIFRTSDVSISDGTTTGLATKIINSKNDSISEQMNNSSSASSDAIQTIIHGPSPVTGASIIQVATSGIDNQLIQTNQASTILSTNTSSITQPTVQLPIKISGSQSIFVSNQGLIGSNVQTLGNTLVSYILPSNSLQKQTLVQKPTVSTVNVAPATAIVASNLANTSINNTDASSTTATLINTVSGPTIINPNENNASKMGNPSNVKLIQTNQRNLMFSPIKPAANTTMTPIINKPVGNQALNNRISIKQNQMTGKTTNSGGLTNADLPNKASTQQQYAAPAIVATNTNQQQLIILSPVKTSNQTSKPTQFIPSFKILPNSKLPTIAPAVATTTSTKRVIAPAPVNKSISSVVSAANTRPIQTTSNKNVHYISFVPFTSSNQINASTSSTTKYVPLKPSTTGINKVTTTSHTTTIKPNMVQVTPKVLVNPSSIKISATVASSAPSTTVTSQTNSKTKSQATSIWMLPKQIIKVNENSANAIMAPKPAAKFIPIAPNPNQAANFQEVQKISVNSISRNMIDNYEESRRKACNCTRSQCLKLYCDCFANGEFCNNCNCVSCCNNLEHEEIRQKAIRLCLERNPNAFHPKIGQTHHGDIERRHTKGCCCKRSGCLKNYCECYEAKILCSDKCKCIGCKNFEESTERKTLMHLADAAEVRSAQQSVASKMHVWGPDFKPKLPVKVKGDCHPFNVLNNDILEATASCLLAQAEEGEFENLNDENIEGLILDQFGECLSQILNLSCNGISDDFDINSDDDDTMNDDIDAN